MDELQIVLDRISERISVENLDIAWTHYDSAHQLRQDFEKLKLSSLKGDTAAIQQLQMWFLPTSTLQELSLDNGWGDEFLELAQQFDQAVLNQN